MAELIVNPFAEWQLNEEEERQGSMLTITQTQVIQNQVARLASEKLLLQPDPNDIANYYQKEAYIRGQIDSLQYLLDVSSSLQEPNQPEEPNQ
jgi:hypothetical protein